MMVSEWNIDTALAVRFEEGVETGEEQKALKFAANLKAKGMPVAEIADATGLTVDDILRLED